MITVEYEPTEAELARAFRLTRSRHADDVNAEVREAVDQNGYSLFRTGLSLSEIPKP